MNANSGVYAVWAMGFLGLLAGLAEANPIEDVPHYRQDDPRWGNEVLDHSKDGVTIAQQGCSLTCYAMLFTWKSQQLDLRDDEGKPIVYTPHDLNAFLKTNPDTVIKDKDGNVVEINVTKLRMIIQADSKARDVEGKGIGYRRVWEPGRSDGEDGVIPAVPQAGQAPSCGDWVTKLIDKGMPVLLYVDSLNTLTNLDDGTVVIEGRGVGGHFVLVTGYRKQGDQCEYIFHDPAGVADDTTDSDSNGDVFYPDYHDFAALELIPEPASGMLLSLCGMVLLTRRRRSRGRNATR